MKTRPFIAFAILALLLSGCSRTSEDIARWESNGNAKKLIDALQDPKVEIRIAAAEALGELKAEKAVNALGTLYSDAEDEAVLAAVKALASIKSNTATTPLIAALKLNNSEARLTAIITLGEMKATGAVSALCESLSDSESANQYAAAQALGEIGDEKGSKSLAEQLNSGSEKLRLDCVISLGKIGGEIATKGLISAMDDKSPDIQKEAIDSLVALGNPAVIYVIEALKADSSQIRSGAISVLNVPPSGTDYIWFLLARVSVDDEDIIDPAVVSELVEMGNSAVETLLEAASHNVSDFREHAFLALENMGEPCVEQALATAHTRANPKGKVWFAERESWIGAPDWHIDLWAAVASLNPEFGGHREPIPLWISQLGEAQPQSTMKQLTDAGNLAVFPLIAACSTTNSSIADQTAEILGNIGDIRAAQALMAVFEKKILEGEKLSSSPFYNALLKLDDPAAEPLLLKVRPNPYRSMRVFECKYPTLRAISAESRNASEDDDQPIVFRIGYINRGKMAEFEISFAKDELGDWKPSPPLPSQLPSSKK